MGIKLDLEQIISQVGRDKGISRQILVKALESAVLSAAKKHYGYGLNLEATYNPEIGEIELHEFKVVVDDVRDSATQITLKDARKEFDPDCEVGDELGRKLPSEDLGRIAAQTAKQVISQKLRDAERENIFEEFKDRKGEVVNGIVQRVERGNIIVNLGRTDAVLPIREQITKEKYRTGDRVRALILDVYPISKGPQVVLSRSHPDFMRKLFEQNVPEIAEGIVEIKAVSREPGERAKIAVYSNDPNVDPEGACIGIKGSRVQSVVTELRGERVDIITWTPDFPSFVARSLAPAQVTRVVVDEDEHSMELVVGDDQLSLAIGRKGQNVRLASKLTGWKIDVRSESIAEEENKRARKSLETITGIGFGEAELLFQEGFRSLKEFAQASIDDLSELDAIPTERITVLHEEAKLLSARSGDSDGDGEGNGFSNGSEIKYMILANDIKEALTSSGYRTVDELSTFTEDEIGEKAAISVEDSIKVMKAVESFMRGRS